MNQILTLQTLQATPTPVPTHCISVAWSDWSSLTA